MKYLLDTNVVVKVMRGQKSAVKKINEVVDEGLGLSSVSLAELYHGVDKSMRSKKGVRDINKFLEMPDIKVINFTKIEAREFGRLMNRLEEKRLRLDGMDVLIAATAKMNKLIVLTSDKRHFGRLAKFGVKIELI